MTFRARLLFAAVPLTVLPLLVLAFGVRGEMEETLEAEYQARVDAMKRVVEEDLEQENDLIASRLSALAVTIANDNRLRVAIVDDVAAERPYVLDYAGTAMQLAGLDVLQIQDGSGRILSSGHFRNDFDRIDLALPSALSVAGRNGVIAEVRTAERAFPALLRLESVQLGSRTLMLTGGIAVDEAFVAGLQRGEGLSVALVYPGGTVTAGDDPSVAPNGQASSIAMVQQEFELGFIPAAAPERGEVPAGGSARFVISQSLGPLEELRRTITAWFVGAGAGAVALAMMLGLMVASRMSRPLTELAEKTQRLDLDRLDVEFVSERSDEIGILARTLGALTQRLRNSAGRLREAERRATIGDIARQMHHDVRNGLTPIRNVVEHLTQLARERPSELPDVFLERQATLDASISYLQSLAANYARLSPRLDGRPCDVNGIVREVIGGVSEEDRDRVRAQLADAVPPVAGDPVALRRIVENLIANALESLPPPEKASVQVSTATDLSNGEPRVHIVVADTGRGMTKEELEKIFDDFYTTKERGTGLGLSIVRRLVNDLGGTVRVESRRGQGTRFRIELPVLNDASIGHARTSVAPPTQAVEGANAVAAEPR